MKDLPDVALLAGVREIDDVHLRSALEQTFASRKMQSLPKVLPEPPSDWMPQYAQYARMADEDELRWSDLTELTRAVRAFLDPVLGGAPRNVKPRNLDLERVAFD